MSYRSSDAGAAAGWMAMSALAVVVGFAVRGALRTWRELREEGLR